MKKRLLLCAFLAWPFLAEAQQWVNRDSCGTWLKGTDIDTVYFIFPNVPLSKIMASDTTKNGVTLYKPPSFVRMAGDFDLWLDRLNHVGTADSFKVWYKLVDPFSGRLARNDSTFIVGSASAFANFTSTSRYSITLPTCFGFGVIIRQADTTLDTTRVLLKLAYSQ